MCFIYITVWRLNSKRMKLNINLSYRAGIQKVINCKVGVFFYWNKKLLSECLETISFATFLGEKLFEWLGLAKSSCDKVTL